MSSVLFNIGADVVRLLIDLIAAINEVRAGSAVLKILLWPLVYALTFAKVVLNYFVFGAHKFYYYSMPYNIVTTRNHFFSATPMSVYCFNKRGLGLLFVEMIFFFYLMCIPLRKPLLILPYMVFKIVLTSLPFVALTPVQRLPFWFLAVLFMFVETAAGILIIRTWGYGINFEHDHFYNHWGKHYRYRAITSNRVIGTELSQYLYVIAKILILNDYFCYDAEKFNTRLLKPHTPTWGDVTPCVVDNLGHVGFNFYLAAFALFAVASTLSDNKLKLCKTMLLTLTFWMFTLFYYSQPYLFFLATPPGYLSSLSPYPFLLSAILTPLFIVSVATMFFTNDLDALQKKLRPARERLWAHFCEVRVLAIRVARRAQSQIKTPLSGGAPKSNWSSDTAVQCDPLTILVIAAGVFTFVGVTGRTKYIRINWLFPGAKAAAVITPHPPAALRNKPVYEEAVAHAQNWADNIGAVHPEAKNFLGTAFIKEHVESAVGDHFFTSSERARMQKFTENTDRYVGEVDAFCKQAAALNHKNNPFKVLRGAASCLEPAFYSRFNLSALQESTTHVFSRVSYGIFNFFNKHIDLYELRSFPVVLPPRPMTLASAETDFDFISALVEQDSVANLRYGVLFLLALSSLGVYSIILAGWSSNSKYAFIGALRSAAQMISYEVAISLIILPVVIFCGSLDLSMIAYVQHITTWLSWPLFPIAILFLVAMLAETNRTPFDLPEAEAELVAGYNVDYSSLPFAMFFLGEYCNMILISTLFCILFVSGGLNNVGIASAIMLSVKSAVAWVFFVLVRATLPRYRYDQLMDIGWKIFLPTSGSFLLFAFGILVVFRSLPVANELPCPTYCYW